MMSPDHRKKLVWLSLSLTLLATLYAYFDEQKSEQVAEVVEAARLRPTNADLSSSQSQPLASSKYLGTRFVQASQQDIFQTGTVTLPELKAVEVPQETLAMPLPPVAIAVTPEPAVPSAPPLPFVYIGKYVEDGELRVFLGHQGANLIIRDGDVIQQLYKVESIKPPLMTLRYIPLDVAQHLAIGELQ